MIVVPSRGAFMIEIRFFARDRAKYPWATNFSPASIWSYISDLTTHGDPRGCVECLYGCGVARDDDAGEVRTQWVKPKTSPSSSLSIPR